MALPDYGLVCSGIAHQGQRRGQQTGQQAYQHTLTHEYDELGNRTKTTLPDGKTLNSLYYGSGHLYNQSITDEQGNVSELRHSTTNELHQEISRQQGSLDTQFDYDPMGRLLKQSNQHIQRHYAYDALGQLTHLSGNTNITALTSKGYQRNHQYQYDPIGRLTQHKLTDFAKQTGTTETFAFDPASNRVPVSTNENHKDYQINPLTGVLYGHETLPNGHPHKTIPHINIIGDDKMRRTIYIKKCRKR